MTPARLAELHGLAFRQSRPWSAAEFADLLEGPHVALLAEDHGFALIRTLAGESELLTLAVDPARQRRGIARGLMDRWIAALPPGTERAFLEVAADNGPAIALYEGCQFARVGKRPGYYARQGAKPVDAWLMARDLTLGQSPGEQRHGPRIG